MNCFAITCYQVPDLTYRQLNDLKHQLVVQKMKLDKFFSIFLDSSEMDENDTDTPEWVTYREMIKRYQHVEQMLTATTYYIGKHERYSSV